MSENTAKATPEKSGSPEMKGWLLKWTNYIKGYQRRWFVLSNGVLSYYRNQGEMNHTCRGTISLHGALIHAVDSCTFVISNGGTQTFHIKAANEVERQSWVTALELAKAKAIRAIESEEEEEEVTAQVVPSQEINAVVRDLTERLENLRTCYDLITKHGLALQRALTDLETNQEESLAARTKIVNERATLFRITANAMINACHDYLTSAESQGHKWSKVLQHERVQRQRVEEVVEQLAKEQTQLEQAAHQVQHKRGRDGPVILTSVNSTNTVTSDDETEFFDAEETSTCCGHDASEQYNEFLNVDSAPTHIHLNNVADEGANNKQPHHSNSGSSSSDDDGKFSITSSVVTVRSSADHSKFEVHHDTVDRALLPKLLATYGSDDKTLVKSPPKQRRTRVPDKPNYPLNLWSVMKNCIGKELSKIPMPVNFNEPLSMLQRLTEDYEYANILDAAAQCTDECEQLAYLAAFTISAYSTTSNRTGKPFNPLLGETFECDRMDDLGWRCFAEQVSHHPPMAALHCEGREWTCWQEFTMTSKFRGKYLQVIPMGNAYVNFERSGHKYVWRKVTTTINNIIVGKLWVDQSGEMEITGLNAAAGLKCILKYIPYSYFSRDTQRRVKGFVKNRKGEVKWLLRGTWDSKIEIAPVLATMVGGNLDEASFQTGPYKAAWTRRVPPPDSDKFYNFTELACQLNEMEEDVAPTDCRLRPDQRLMEEGRWDESNREKLRLEEKQRKKRRAREAEAEKAAAQGQPYPPYEPIWFSREKEEGSDSLVHVFKGVYWEKKQAHDWSACPDLY